MRRRPLGKHSLEITELALGTWGLSGDGYGPVPELEQDKVIVRALALGFRVFDTSDSYGDGAMERRLGHHVPEGDEYFIVTKLGTDRNDQPPRKRFDLEHLKTAFERSRERLRRSVLGAVLLHNPSRRALERGEATEWLKQLKLSGQIRTWGVCVTTADVARLAIVRGAEVLALPYNIFHARELHELQGDIESAGTGVLAHSVLAYGMLCGKWSSDKEFDYVDHRAERWTPDEFRRRIRQLDAVRPSVGGELFSMRAVALRYALANPQVSSTIIGPRSTLQLDQLVREAGEAPYLADDKRFALHARLQQVGVIT